MRNAKESFKKSAENKFNLSASKYYIAHISQILDEFKIAKENYEDLIKLPDSDEKMMQIGNFQLAETLLSIMREENKNLTTHAQYVKDTILPMMENAIDIDKKSTISSDIEKRITSLKKEFDLDPDALINGRRLPSKRIKWICTSENQV